MSLPHHTHARTPPRVAPTGSTGFSTTRNSSRLGICHLQPPLQDKGSWATVPTLTRPRDLAPCLCFLAHPTLFSDWISPSQTLCQSELHLCQNYSSSNMHCRAPVSTEPILRISKHEIISSFLQEFLLNNPSIIDINVHQGNLSPPLPAKPASPRVWLSSS